MNRCIVPGILLVLLSSCATPSNQESTNPMPEWVRHPSDRYSEQRFLTAVGVGASREEAIRDAKKNMAESFLVKVQSLTKSTTESKLAQDTEGSVKGESDQNVSKETRFESVTRLRGAEVKEVATVGGETYVLLALDRLSARSGLLMECNQLRSRIEANLDSLEERFQGKPFRETRQDLETLRELSSEGSVLGMSALLDTDALERRIRKLESSMRAQNQKFVFQVKTLKGDDRFSRELESCIQDQGGTIYSGDQPRDHLSQIQISVIEQPQHLAIEGWVKVKYEVSANLINPDGKSIRINESKVETARSKEAGLQAAADELSAKICEQAWNRLGELK
jgi:hypothetical protein